MPGKRPDWTVSTVVDAGEKKRWRELGVAYATANDTISIYLDGLPVSGKLVLTRPKERHDPELRRE